MDFERVFCFGCSWTHYKWPTWADLCRYGTDKPVYNWGLRGIGNVGILHRMLEADLKHQFTDKDLILVQWTTWTREDRYINKWQAGGAVFNNDLYDKEFIKKYWSWNNDIIKNSTAIISANRMFNIAYQYTFHPFPTEPDFGFNDPLTKKEILALYRNSLPSIPIFPQSLNTDFEGNCLDGHADINAHLKFFDQNIKPLGFDLKENYLRLAVLHDSIAQQLDKKQSHNYQWAVIKELVSKFDKTIDGPTLGF